MCSERRYVPLVSKESSRSGRDAEPKRLRAVGGRRKLELALPFVCLGYIVTILYDHTFGATLQSRQPASI